MVEAINEEALQTRLDDGRYRSQFTGNDSVASNPFPVSDECCNNCYNDHEQHRAKSHSPQAPGPVGGIYRDHAFAVVWPEPWSLEAHKARRGSGSGSLLLTSISNGENHRQVGTIKKDN
jgi:hypothetical protein